MSQVSRPMQIALLVVIAFAGVWFVALRPKPAADAGTPAAAPTAPGAAGLTGAVDKAHGAVATSDAANKRLDGQSNGVGGAPPATVPSTAGAPTHRRAHASTPGHQRPGHARHHARGQGRDPVKRRLAVVHRALRAGRVLVIAFYNPASSSGKAVREEVGDVHGRRGRVVRVAAPIRELSRYPLITRQVQIVASPTVVIVDRRHHAQTITGFTDVHVIEQRVADALTVRRG